MRNYKILNNKYHIVRQLKDGQKGNVYLCENIQLKKSCIIKEYSKNQSSELEILMKLRHPCIPQVINWFKNEEYTYIVEDYFEGKTLKKIIKEKGAIEEKNTIYWTLQLCEILKYLHNINPKGFAHGDISPSNIILSSIGLVKLVDFGTSQCLGQDENCFGTIGYAAPEQFGLDKIDERTDIFGVGAVLYHMLSGEENSRPIFLIAEDSKISKNMIKIIRKCTAYKKDMRYENIERLERVLKDRYGSSQSVNIAENIKIR